MTQRRKKTSGNDDGSPGDRPYHYLHADTPEGFIEYEFHADGKLLAYYDMEQIPEAKKAVQLMQFQPVFKVVMLTWKRNTDEIVVNHGNEEEIIKISVDGGNPTSASLKWKKVDHLELVAKIYSYCERPLSK